MSTNLSAMTQKMKYPVFIENSKGHFAHQKSVKTDVYSKRKDPFNLTGGYFNPCYICPRMLITLLPCKIKLNGKVRPLVGIANYLIPREYSLLCQTR